MKQLIAKNGTYYTISYLPDNFWNEWKTNKDAMKAQGLSPFKRDDSWYLAHYDNSRKATEKEIKDFNIYQTKLFIGFLNLEPENDKQDEIIGDLLDCENVESVINILKANACEFNDV